MPMSTTPSTSTTIKPGSESGGRPVGDSQRVARLLEKLPPHAIEGEMCLLGSILIEPRALGDVTLIIRDGGDFYKPTNGEIYDVMVELYDANASLDIVQLNQRLTDREILDAVGGQDYLVELASCVPSAANAEHYARLVREKAMVRKLIDEAGKILYRAYDSRDPAATILDEAEHRIFSIAERYEHSDVESLGRLVQEVVSRLKMPTGSPRIAMFSAMFSANAVFPMEGRPAMMMKSPG